MIPLLLIAAAYGMATTFLFQRLLPHKAFRQSTNRILAHVIAFRLFVDEPRLVLRNQWQLLKENLRLLRLLAWPLVIAALVYILLFSPLDRRFGHRPLHPGETTVLTLPAGSELNASPDFAIETSPVHVPRLRQISWRVRAIKQSPLLSAPATLYGAPWFLWFLLGTVLGGGLALPLARQPDIEY